MAEGNLIDLLITGAGAVVAWFVKSTREDNKDQDRKIEILQKEQAGLLSREEFRQDMHLFRQEMNANFAKVFDKLDKKMDKD